MEGQGGKTGVLCGPQTYKIYFLSRFGKRSGQQTPPSSQLEYYNDADYNGFDETLKGLMDLKKRLIIAEAKRRLGAGYEGMGRRET